MFDALVVIFSLSSTAGCAPLYTQLCLSSKVVDSENGTAKRSLKIFGVSCVRELYLIEHFNMKYGKKTKRKTKTQI